MPPLYRATFFFQQGENGWSESIHINSTDTATLITLCDFYQEKRLAFCHAETSMSHIRISDDNTFRDIILDPISLPLIGQWKGNQNAEGPWTALDLRLQAIPTVNRSMFVRGFPAGQIDSNVPKFTSTFANLYNAFVTYITGGPFSIKNKDRTQNKQPILSLGLDGTVVMGNPITGLTKGATVQVLGIPRSQIPVRTYIVNPFTDESHFVLRGYKGPLISNTGFLRLVNYVLLPITKSATDAVTERRVGRPFGQQRGRRAVVR